MKDLFSPIPKTLKDLKGLYFAGQWVQPGGGLPTCLMTGKGIIQMICKEDWEAFCNQPAGGTHATHAGCQSACAR